MNGRDLKKLRERLGFKSQVDLSLMLGVHSTTVSRWECDVIPIPKPVQMLFEIMERKQEATDV